MQGDDASGTDARCHRHRPAGEAVGTTACSRSGARPTSSSVRRLHVIWLVVHTGVRRGCPARTGSLLRSASLGDYGGEGGGST